MGGLDKPEKGKGVGPDGQQPSGSGTGQQGPDDGQEDWDEQEDDSNLELALEASCKDAASEAIRAASPATVTDRTVPADPATKGGTATYASMVQTKKPDTKKPGSRIKNR